MKELTKYLMPLLMLLPFEVYAASGMELGSAIVFIVCLVVFALIAYWIITKFFKEDPLQRILLIIVGAICLLALVYKFWPGVMHTPV